MYIVYMYVQYTYIVYMHVQYTYIVYILCYTTIMGTHMT